MSNDCNLPFLCQLGYTFVAGAIIPESLPFGTEWRMRLIGLNHLLPKLSHEGPLKPFSMKQFREYYIPIYKNLICR